MLLLLGDPRRFDDKVDDGLEVRHALYEPDALAVVYELPTRYKGQALLHLWRGIEKEIG